MNILLTYADNRNDNKTSTFMDGGPLNCRWGADLTACVVGLRSHSRSHWGHCSTRTGPSKPQWFFAGAMLSIVNSFVLSCTYGNVDISQLKNVQEQPNWQERMLAKKGDVGEISQH